MKNRHILFAGAIAAFALAAPATGHAQGAGCNHGTRPNCDVTITITADPADPSAMVITVSPYVLGVSSNRHNQKITFNLVSAMFTFPDDAYHAIRVENDHGQFGGNAHGPDKGHVITITDSNTDTSLYKYSIEVVDANGQHLTVDPLIKNGD
jgi:hypothetical protein